MELATGRHVEVHALLVGEARHCTAQEGLGGVGDAVTPRGHGLTAGLAQMILVVDEERGAELLDELQQIDAADVEVALLVDRRGTRQQMPFQRRGGDIVVRRHGDAGYGSIRRSRESGDRDRPLPSTIVVCSCKSRPRSSADRAPASGAGGAGSSPAGGAYIFPNQTPFLEALPSQPAEITTIDLVPQCFRRKRQQRTKAVHVQDSRWNKEGSGHRSGGVRHRGRQREDCIIASRGDHGLADAQQMAGLEEDAALPRYNRPISSCDQARRTGDWIDARLLDGGRTTSKTSTARWWPKDSRGRQSGRFTGHFANRWPWPIGVDLSRSLPPTASSSLHSGPEKWNRHPPTMCARLSNTCLLRT